MRLPVIALLLLISTCVFAQHKAEDLLGNWMTQDDNGKIEIFTSGGKYYGKIAWIKEPLDKNGAPKTDQNNPDESMRNRRIIGLLLLKGFTFNGSNAWTDGTIYDPLNGKDYSCKITMNPDGTLNIRGYIGVSLIGRTTVWTRAK